MTPETGRIAPSRPSSPTHACAARRNGGTCPDAASSVRAIARSKPVPSFRSAAGARLTVMTWPGHSSNAEWTPLRTRCFASWQARSARPTIENEGCCPERRCASTSTRRGSRPTSANVTARPSTSRPYDGTRHETVPITSHHRNVDGDPRRSRPKGGFAAREAKYALPQWAQKEGGSWGKHGFPHAEFPPRDQPV